MNWKPHEGMEGLTRGIVTGDSGEDYFIDLAYHEGIGFCSCPQFQCRVQPKISREGATGDEARCKHIVYVRHQVGQELLNTFIQNINKQNQ